MNAKNNYEKKFTYRGEEFYYSPATHTIGSNCNADSIETASRKLVARNICIETMWLCLTDKCNLSCNYCFNGYSSDNLKVMSYGTARKAVVLLAKLWSETGGKNQPRIIFFGGEPLINWDVLENTVLFAREWTSLTGIPFVFTLSTNATLITERISKFLAREKVAVQISIDGDQKVHDKHRKYSSGLGSHSSVVNNIPMLLNQKKLHINARATVIENETPLSERIKYIRQLGFKSIHVKYVSDNATTTPTIKTDELEKYLVDIDNVVAELIDAQSKGTYVFPFSEHIKSLRTLKWREFVCATGSVAISVAPDGWVYPCHRFTDNDDYRICHVTGDFDKSISDKFGLLRTDTLPICQNCWARRFCWGCCPAESVSHGLPLGHPTTSWCEAKKLEALVSLKLSVALDSEKIHHQARA